MHDAKLRLVGTPRELRRAQAPDAMLGAEAPAELAHEVVHRLLERGLARADRGGVCAGPLADFEMQVAIAQVPVGDPLAIGDEGLCEQGAALYQCGQRRD